MSEISDLQDAISAVESKISQLEAAKKTVEGVDTTIESQMSGIENLHVAGSKYDEQMSYERDAINQGRDRLKKSYQEATVSAINENIGTLRQMKANLDVQLTAAVHREQVRQANEQRRLAEERNKRKTS